MPVIAILMEMGKDSTPVSRLYIREVLDAFMIGNKPLMEKGER